VEHTCDQCHSAVQDDAAFCANCGAPQIRFSGREAAPPPVTLKDPPIPQTQIPAEAHYISPATTRSHSNVFIRSALYAAILGAILSLVPIGAAFVLALPIAGFLSILFYRRRTLVEEPSPAIGFRLGSLTGFFTFLIFLVLTSVQILAFHAQNELRDTMLQAIRQAQARNPEPQARQMLEYFMTPQGLVFMMVFGFIFLAIVFVLLAGLGGTVSASLLRRRPPLS
jgi:hypothetical protein